tara:strand:+ start:192 stop:467 length:276 start_codon:yes stop_codon:yes gene_type:complete
MIIVEDGIIYNRWSKSKYRDIYPSRRTWKIQRSSTNKVLPKYLKYLTAHLLMGKMTYTAKERVAYAFLVNMYVKVYNSKTKVFAELLNRDT